MGGDHNLFIVGKYWLPIDDPINLPIRIEDDTMIGMDAMILKGVTIGEGAVIDAKALITKSILPYTIAVGNPAKMVKLRFNVSDLKDHIDKIQSTYQVGHFI